MAYGKTKKWMIGGAALAGTAVLTAALWQGLTLRRYALHTDKLSAPVRLLLLTDHILNQLNDNHNLARLISKNLSWGFFKNFLYTPPDSEHPSIYSIYEKLLSDAKDSYRDPDMMMYLILELVSGSSYNAILFQEPVPLAELKPLLYETIRGILRQHKEKPAEK